MEFDKRDIAIEEKRHKIRPTAFLKDLRLVFSVGWNSFSMWLLVVLVIGGVLLRSFMNLYNSTYSGLLICSLTSTCADHSLNNEIHSLIFEAVFVNVILSSGQALADCFGYLIGRKWRKALTQRLHDLYFRGNRFYNLLNRTPIDNPDQRISQDVKQLCEVLCSSNHPPVDGLLFGPRGLLTSVIICIFYAYEISKQLTIQLAFVPFLYYLFTSYIMKLLADPMVKKTFAQERLEGDFRFQHVRFREYAESIAFYRGEKSERAVSEKLLDKCIDNQKSLVGKAIPPISFKQLQTQIGYLIPYFLLLYLLSSDDHCWSTEKTIGMLINVGQLCEYLSQIQGVFPIAANFAGLVRRVSGIMRRLDDELDSAHPKASHVAQSRGVGRKQSNIGGTVVETSKLLVSLDRVTVAPPKQMGDHSRQYVPLIEELSLTVECGDSLVITGPSGVGKSSILRTIAGLWPPVKGTVHVPGHIGRNGILFLPQKAYIVLGSLKTQVTYPLSDDLNEIPDGDIMSILRQVRLGYLLEKFTIHDVHAWDDMLSVGEQQRLAFARLLFLRPAFAFMDEATSALDGDLEDRLLGLVVEKDITMISVAHRTSAIKFHSRVLNLVRNRDTGTVKYEIQPRANVNFDPHEIEMPAFQVIDQHVPKTDVGTGSSAEGDSSYQMSSVRQRKQPSETEKLIATPTAAADVFHTSEKVKKTFFVRNVMRVWRYGFPKILSVEYLMMVIYIGLLITQTQCMIHITKSLGVLQETVGCLESGEAYIDVPMIYYWVLRAEFFALGVMMSSTLTDILGWVIGYRWRDRLTKQLHKLYYGNRGYYKVLAFAHPIDNPDQRISADIKTFTDSFTGGCVPIMTGVFLGTRGILSIVFATALYTLSLSALHNKFTLIGPYVVFVGFLIVTTILGLVIKRLTYTMEAREGDFRYAHSRFRTFAESVAFYKGVVKEKKIAEDRLNNVLRNQLRLILQALPLQIINYSSMYLSFFISPFIILYLSGIPVAPAKAIFITETIGNLVQQLTLLTMLSRDLAVCAGTLERISELMVYLKSLVRKGQEHELEERGAVGSEASSKTASTSSDLDSSMDLDGPINISESTPLISQLDRFPGRGRVSEILATPRGAPATHPAVSLENVVVMAPDGKLLLDNLSLKMASPDSWVIVGPSGSGKSSLLRVLGELWPTAGGALNIPPEGMHFLPQRPYSVIGTLRAQIIYPHKEADYTSVQLSDIDATLMTIIKKCHMLYLMERHSLDTVADWSEELSGGELQRLGFARLFYHQPLFAIMDESTSAMDIPLEKTLLNETAKLGVTMISVAHRPSVVRKHTRAILLEGGGTFSVNKILS